MGERMEFASKRRLYELMPGAGRAVAGLIPFAWLAGSSYRKTKAELDRMDRLNAEEILAIRNRRLGHILHHATQTVPAYRPYRGLVERLSPMEALKGFPFIGRDELQANMEAFLSSELKAIPHYECTTGGTSGRQMRVILDDTSQAVEMAYMHSQWARVGYDPRCRKATFRGVLFRHMREGEYWQANPAYNEMQFSPCHLNADTVEKYVKKLFEYRPEFLHGYPSAISDLAEYGRRRGFPLSSLGVRAALLGSERATAEQRGLIEGAFGTKVYTWYGHSERVVLAGECALSTAYHAYPTYGITEIVDADGNAVGEGEAGELVGTGLLNRSMPLIRYRTGDRVRRRSAACDCRRVCVLFDEVEGRWAPDFVFGRSRTKISLVTLNIHGPALDNVFRYQYYQSTPGRLELRVMVLQGFSDRDVKRIEDIFRSKTAGELVVSVRVMDDIPLTPRGKFLRLIREETVCPR